LRRAVEKPITTRSIAREKMRDYRLIILTRLPLMRKVRKTERTPRHHSATYKPLRESFKDLTGYTSKTLNTTTRTTAKEEWSIELENKSNNHHLLIYSRNSPRCTSQPTNHLASTNTKPKHSSNQNTWAPNFSSSHKEYCKSVPDPKLPIPFSKLPKIYLILAVVHQSRT